MDNTDPTRSPAISGATDQAPGVGGLHQAPDLDFDLDALSLDPEATPTMPSPQRVSLFRRVLRRMDVIILCLIAVGGIVLFVLATRDNAATPQQSASPASRFGTVTLPLDELVEGKNLELPAATNVTINGPMQLNSGLRFAPSPQPNGALPGQLYFDQEANQLAYFNGSAFIFLDDPEVPAANGVQGIGGLTGQVDIGQGLTAADGRLSVSGVLSLMGQTGDVTLTAGNGIAIDGTTITNSGIITLASGSANLTVATDADGNAVITSSLAGGGTVSSGGGTPNAIAKFTGAQTIADSLLSDDGAVVTVGGDLAVTGAITLSAPLTVASGGTGAASLALDGVLVGQGTGAIVAVTSAAPGECLLSTAGTPAFGVCPGSGGSGVSSLNGLTGGLNISNATGSGATITIDDASTSAKGIASFDATNFTVTGGAVDTVQNIDTSATPSFSGVNTNTITPSGPMTLGSITNTALLQGSITTITSSGSGNDIILDAADVIDLFDNTNITGTLDVSAGFFAGTGNAFQITTAGVVTAAGTATFQGGFASVGTSAQAGVLVLNDGSLHTGTLQLAALGQNTVYTLPDPGSATASICLTTGNCVGLGGGVTSAGGTVDALAKFTGAQTIGDSIISDDGSLVTIAGALSVNTITPSAALSVGATNQNAVLQGAVTTITATNSGTTNTLGFATPAGGNKTITIPNASGTIAVSVSGPLALDANGNLTCSACVTSGGGGGGVSAVDSLNGLTGVITLANASGSGATITIDDATTAAKGIASFNATNFTVVAGAVNTVQNINTTATPTFAAINTDTITPATSLAVAGDIDVSGAFASGTANAFQITGGGTVTSAGNATFTAGTVTVGDATQFGRLVLSDGSSSTATIQPAALGQNTQYILPDPGVGSVSFCLTSGNCTGLGGGVTSAGGTINVIAKFTGSQTIADSLLSESGSVVTVNGSLNITSGNQFRINGTQISSAVLSNDSDLAKLSAAGQTFTGNNTVSGAFAANGDVTLGNAAADSLTISALLQGGTPLVFEGASVDANQLSLVIAALTADRTITLPDATGTVCLQNATACGFALSSGSGNYIQNGTSLQTANFYIQSASTGDVAATIRGASGQVVPVLSVVQGSSGNTVVSVSDGGTVTLGNDIGPAQGRIVWHDVVSSNSNTVTLTTTNSISGSRSIQLPDESGVICVQASFSCDFIVSQAASDQGANFRIGGNGQAASFLSTLFDTASTVALNIGTSNATVINLNEDTSVATGKSLTVTSGTLTAGGVLTADGNVSLGDATADFVTVTGTIQGASPLVFEGGTADANELTISIASLTTDRTITLPDATGTVCLDSGNCNALITLQTAYANGNIITTTDNRDITFELADTANDANVIIDLQCDTTCGTDGRFMVQDDGASVFSIMPAGGAALFRNAANSTSGFEVETSGGGNFFTIDTLNSRIGINLGGTTTPTLTNNGVELQGAIRFSGGRGIGAGFEFMDSYTSPLGATLTAKINIANLDPGANGQVIALGVTGSETTARGISVFDTRSSAHQPSIALLSPDQNQVYGLSWDGSNSNAYLKSSASTIILQAASTNVITASSTSVGLGQDTTVAAGETFTVTSALTSLTSATTGDALHVSNSTSTGNIAVFSDNGTAVATIANGGATTFQNSTNSTTAFRVLNAGSVPQFVLDTTSSRVYVGNPTADTTGALLVLDTSTDTADPTGTDGAMYYSSGLGGFRCHEDGQWEYCRDPRSLTYGFRIEEDFINGSDNVTALTMGDLGWDDASVGTNGYIVNISPDEARRPGQMLMNAGASGESATIYLGDVTTEPIILGGDKVIIDLGIRINTLATGTQDYTFRAGLCDVLAAQCTDGVYLEYNRSTSTNWITATAAGGTRTRNTTSTAVATGWHNVRMIINGDGVSTPTSVDYFIDGTYIGSNTNPATIPTGSGEATMPMYQIVKTAGSTDRDVRIDYFNMTSSFGGR